MSNNRASEGGYRVANGRCLMRSTFEQITADLIERVKGPVEQAMGDAKLTSADLDEVILVGGSTRMPAVQETGAPDDGARTPT